MRKIYATFLCLCILTTAFSQNPLLLRDVFPGATGSGIQQIVKTSNYTFFNADDDDADTDRGLFRTDGTPGGTIKLNLTYPTYLSTKAEKLTALGDKIVFAGDNLNFYGEIWVSDGTQAGTIALERFEPSTYSTFASRRVVMDMAALNTDVLYGVKNTDNHLQLKKTDGTPGNMVLLKDFGIYADTDASLALFKTINGILYFNLFDGNSNDQLWRSDGTAAGTYMVNDFGNSQYVASYLMPAGNNFYVMLITPGTGNVLWKSDGTTAGTTALKTIGLSGNNNYPSQAAIGSTLYFGGLNGSGMELWKTDGTTAGTVMIADINPGAGSSLPKNFTVLNNILYFSADDGNGNKLWKWDGTAISLVKDINPVNSLNGISAFAVSNNTILLNASSPAMTDAELWITDGTTANTRLVSDVNPGSAASNPGSLTPGNPVYFSATNGTNGMELFKYDNTGGIEGLRKIYVNDNSLVGDIFTTAIGSNANPGTSSAPVATMNYALSLAAEGDTIITDAGTYAEQVTVTKGITIKGAGQNASFIVAPSTIVAPPGTFTETGLIQTGQGIGDVHIQDLSVTGNADISLQCILLQSGGSVKNCKLLNGNQGLFVRVEAAVKTTWIENNYIDVAYIGINCQGSGLTATLINNTIKASNPFFSAGVFFGLDFGPLPQFTATGNSVTGFLNYGFLGGSNNSLITQNSIIDHAGPAISQVSGSQINATCNWFGTTNAETVTSKISGNVSFLPWLVNGVDSDVTANGFQPATLACTGRQNKFYVNDASQAADVYTTAVGNNANNGFSTAPFATINYAMSVAQAGDTIIVDAGSYAERIFVNKSLHFKGAYANAHPLTSLNRGPSETILLPAFENNFVEIVTVQASDVSWDGFLFDGDNPAFVGSITLNGVDVNAGMALFNGNLPTNNLIIKNNIFKNFYRYGLLLQLTNGPLSGILITQNHLDNISSKTIRDGRALGLFNNAYATVTNNYLSRVNTGVFIANFTFGSTDSMLIAFNTIEAYSVGIITGGPIEVSSSITFDNNLITVPDRTAWSAPGSSLVNDAIGVSIPYAVNSKNISLTNNTIVGQRTGINAGAISGSGQLILLNNTVSNQQTGIWLSSINTTLPAFVKGGSISNASQVGLFYIGHNSISNKLEMENVSLANNAVGIDVSAVGGNIQMAFDGVAIQGGTTGIRFYGTQLSLPNNTLSGVSFSNQSKEYILQTVKSFEGQTIDVSSVSFDNITPNNMTLAQLFATEDKLTHKMDFDSVGYFKLRPGRAYLTKNSFAATLPPVFGTPTFTPSIVRAMEAASDGDIIHVGEGNYITADTAISKSLTFLGPNADISPNDPTNKLAINNARVDEAIITGATLKIAASHVAFDGFTFDAGNKSLFTLSNATSINTSGNFNLARNRVKISSAANQIAFTGKSAANVNLIVNAGFTFSDNRFEKYDTTNGTTFNLGFLKNILISDNSFVLAGSKPRTQNVLTAGITGLTDSIYFSSNSADQSNGIVGGNRIANAIISGNKLYNSNTALSMNNNMPQSSSIDISDNEMQSTSGNSPFILYTRVGGGLAGSSNVFKAENNIMTSQAAPGSGQLYGSFNLTVNNSVQDPSILLRGNKLTYNGDYSTVESQYVRPISMRGKIAEATVENNEIVFNNSGSLMPVPDGFLLPINPGITLVTEFGATLSIPSNAIINILNNKIHGFKQSVAIYDGSTGTGSLNEYTGYGNLPAGAVVNINNNSFTGDSISINNGEVGEKVSASCNWYGDKAAAYVATKITRSTVNHIPWLTNGTDNDAAVGFQPVASSCTGIPIDVYIADVSNVTCYGNANGSIDVRVEEGVAPFSYAWSKDNVSGFATTEDLIDLTPGDYKLIVTDAYGYVDSVFASITEPDVLTASATGTNNVCFGATAGSAEVLPGGGTWPYSYLWSNGETTESINSLAAGNYQVRVTDANGCAEVSNYEVTQPTQVTAVATGVSTACSNSASVVASGGTGSLTYLWSNGAITTTISNIASGTYSVAVTDENGCTIVASVTVTANEAFNPAAQVTDVTCFGAANGIITVTNVNGAAPFLYSIDGLVFQTSPVFSGLAAGIHTITVVDANGCAGFVTKTISEPLALSLTLNNVQSTCFGNSTGSINITATGGSGAYSYNWSGPNDYVSTQRNISNLGTGSYTLTVSDNNGCTKILNVFVPVFNAINLSSVVANISCKGLTNGAIDLTVSGGTGNGFIYNWSNGATTADIVNLGPGNYSVTITDMGSGCVVIGNYTITQPASIVNLSFSKTNATGCSSLGTITAIGSGGAGGFMYKLDNGSYQSSGLFTGLYGGSYTVTVKDMNGCTKSSVAAITDNGSDEFESNNSKSQAKVLTVGTPVYARIALATDVADWFKFTTPAGASNYIISLAHSTLYSMSIYPATNNAAAIAVGNTSLTVSLNGNTTYYVQVTGPVSFTCYGLSVAATTVAPRGNPDLYTGTQSAQPSKKELLSESMSEKLKATVFPNPHKGDFQLTITSPVDGSGLIEIMNAAGQIVETRRTFIKKAGNNIIGFTGMRDAILFYRVRLGNEVQSGKIIGPR